MVEAELIGGRERRAIVIVDYDLQWPVRFEHERLRILKALDGTATRVDHIGSTSVAGLAAKPIVDIQVSVPDVSDERSFIPALVAAGYVHRVREPGHHMVRTPELDVHVHIAESGSVWERGQLLFRDWLRTSDADRGLYASVKRALAKREWDDMNEYADAKSDVIREITERAEQWAADTDWETRGATGP